LARRPLTGGVEHRKPDRIHHEDIAAARRTPFCACGLDSAQKLEIEIGLQRLAWLYHQGGQHRLDHGGNTAEVVGVAVGDHHDIEALYPPLSQERQHHPPAGIKTGESGASIDEHPSASGRPEHDRIALPHVEEVDLDLLVPWVPGESGKNGKYPAGQQPACQRPLAYNGGHGPTPADPQHRGEQQTPGEREAGSGFPREMPSRYP